MNQDEVIAEAMRSMGWDPHAEIPMADEENLCILKELAVLMEEKSQLDERQQQNEERSEKLQQHAKNAEVTIEHNLKLLHAYQSEVRTENHLMKLSERERSKLEEDLKNMVKELENMTRYEKATEKEICKRKHRIDEMTSRIKWAKTAMLEWEEAMADGHKGYILIEKYFKEDQQKAKEQDLKRQRLQKEIDKNRQTLIELYDEQKSLEQNLECAANLYRAAHAERRQMVDTWKSAVQQMTQREKDIENGELELLQLKAASKKKADEQKTYDNKLNEVIENNRDVEAAIEELNKDTSEIKEQIQQIRDMVLLKENEVDILQKELQGIANKVQQQRIENRENIKQKANKLEELTKFEELLSKLEQRYASMESNNMSAQQRLQILEDMNDTEQKLQAALTKEIGKINGLVFRAQQQLVKFRDEQKLMEVAIDGIVVNIQAAEKSIQNAEKNLKRQTEIHYEAAFKCLQLERQVIKLQGGIIDPEVERKNQIYLGQLEEQHSKLLKSLQATEAQNAKLDDNMRKLTISYNNDIKAVETIHFQIKEAQVYCEGGVKRIKAETHANQVLMVELSLLKMRANEFEKEIAKCKESSYSLEKHRLHLNRTIKDRLVEIKSQMELLQLKRKHLSEEKSTLKADIGERNIRINAVKGRFELTSKLLGTNDDGTPITATQLKVELAQEKQMLLDQGNELNAKVLKAEEEIKALENTLQMMNGSNEAYRRNFQQDEDAGEATIELNSLKTNYCRSLSQLKTLRNKILEMEQDNEKLAKKKEELEEVLEITTRKKLENTEILNKLQKELNDQKVKMQRADREVKLALKAIRQRAISSEYLKLYDKELDLRELEYRNTSALNQLADIAETDDIIGPKIVRLLADKGIKMPHLLKKTRSFSSWRSELSDISYSSSKDVPYSGSRSSASEDSQSRIQASSTRVSVISLDFPGQN